MHPVIGENFARHVAHLEQIAAGLVVVFSGGDEMLPDYYWRSSWRPGLMAKAAARLRIS